MTNSKWFTNSESDPLADIMRRLASVEAYANDLERKIANFDSPQPISRVDPITYLNPFEGQRAIDPADEQHMWYSNGEWRKAGGFAIYSIKVFEDVNAVLVGDDKFIWEIPEDLDQAMLVKAEGFITTTGGSSTQVAIRLGAPGATGADILSSPIVIDAGEYNSKDAGAATVVVPNTVVSWGQHLHIDVDQPGGGKGLGVMVTLVPSGLATVLLEGFKGDPGGVTDWTGAFNGGSTYTEGQAVSSGGNTYVAITNVPAGITPGVTVGWQTYWQLLVQGHSPYSGITTMILGNGYPLDVGVKAAIVVPFDCTIVEGTLLADVAGSVSVDLWKDTYGAYPPTNADSITASAPLTLTSANKTTDVTLTGWTKTLTMGDILFVVIESTTGLNWLSVGLRVQRA